METKYVCRGRISLYVNFHNNRTMWSTNLHVKIFRWGGGGRKKSPDFYCRSNQSLLDFNEIYHSTLCNHSFWYLDNHTLITFEDNFFFTFW